MKWRPIGTAPAHCRVLVAKAGGIRLIASYGPDHKGERGWFSDDGRPVLSPTHWRPLPDPPAEEQMTKHAPGPQYAPPFIKAMDHIANTYRHPHDIPESQERPPDRRRTRNWRAGKAQGSECRHAGEMVYRYFGLKAIHQSEEDKIYRPKIAAIRKAEAK